MSRLLRRRELPSVELSLQVLATDVVDRVDPAADAILIHETGLCELQKASIDVLAFIFEAVVPRHTDRRLRAFYLQIFQYAIIRENHPRGREAQTHNLSESRQYIMCQVQYGRTTLICGFDNVRIELSTSTVDPKIGTGPAGAVARRFEKRTGEIGPLPCDGSGDEGDETMLNTNPPGKSSIEGGADR
uniref:hypothetical protein n=1 Tax=Halorubrum sp. T3 TaxID=1194088 RepID=UPI001866770C|nr:hypothetical protein [Halorubrum sp. T3]